MPVVGELVETIVLPIQTLRAILQVVVMHHIGNKQAKEQQAQCGEPYRRGRYHGNNCNELHKGKTERNEQMHKPFVLEEGDLGKVLCKNHVPIRMLLRLCNELLHALQIARKTLVHLVSSIAIADGPVMLTQL